MEFREIQESQEMWNSGKFKKVNNSLAHRFPRANQPRISPFVAFHQLLTFLELLVFQELLIFQDISSQVIWELGCISGSNSRFRE